MKRTTDIAYAPIATVLATLLLVFQWLLAGPMFIGRWLLGNAWPGPGREWAALICAAAMSMIWAIWGRPALRRHPLPRVRRLAVTGRQSLVVVAVVVLAGGFSTWLFCGG